MRYGYGTPQLVFGGPMTPMVKALLIATTAVFVLTAIPALTPAGGDASAYIQTYLGMTPALFWGQLTAWMPFTYLFLHSGIFHILFNMLALWMFGGEVENVLGSSRFLIYYFFCGVGAGLLVAILQPGLPIPTVGASGAIYGVMLAYGLFFPERILYFYMVIPIKAKYFVMIIGAIVFFSSFTSAGDGVSHIAHLGGLVFGFIYIKRKNLIGMFRGMGGRKKHKAEVIQMDKIRKMFDEMDNDPRVH